MPMEAHCCNRVMAWFHPDWNLNYCLVVYIWCIPGILLDSEHDEDVMAVGQTGHVGGAQSSGSAEGD